MVHGQSRRVGPGRNGPRVDASMWPAASHGRIHEPERGKVGEWEGLKLREFFIIYSVDLAASFMLV